MDSKTAFITGGSSGIGKPVVSMLQAAGWKVLAPSHAALDLSNAKAIESYVTELLKKQPRIDLFVHIAGIWHDEQNALSNIPIRDFTTEQIVSTMFVGVTAAMLLTALLMPYMQHGTVIGISGTFSDGAAGWLPYYTSKRALEDFLVGLSQDCKNATVYGISPSDTATEAYQRFYPNYYASAQSPETIASLVLSLVTKEHAYRSGEIIEVKQGIARPAFHA